MFAKMQIVLVHILPFGEQIVITTGVGVSFITQRPISLNYMEKNGYHWKPLNCWHCHHWCICLQDNLSHWPRPDETTCLRQRWQASFLPVLFVFDQENDEYTPSPWNSFSDLLDYSIEKISYPSGLLNGNGTIIIFLNCCLILNIDWHNCISKCYVLRDILATKCRDSARHYSALSTMNHQHEWNERIISNKIDLWSRKNDSE